MSGNYSCSDGFCGALDCYRCRGHNAITDWCTDCGERVDDEDEVKCNDCIIQELRTDNENLNKVIIDYEKEQIQPKSKT